MNLEELQKMWQKDSNIDSELLCEESLRVPQLHMKYMEFYNTFALMRKESEAKLRVLIKDKWLYYKGKAPAKLYAEMPFDYKLTSKDEVDMFIEADDEVIKLRLKLDYIEQTISFLDGVLRQVNNRTYQIKNAIEWEKFKNGF